jgi:predicted enzyme involved in methoxymalonyl-ACP biosynthesis
MSCRVLGKKIEDVFISEIFTKLADANKMQITAQYIPTLKNAQVSDFYNRNGFEVISKESDGTIYYQKDLADFVHCKNENYTII